MRYNYKCKACTHEFERMLPMDDRKIPEGEPCPSCGKEDTVVQQIGAPQIVSNSKSTLRQAGGDWNNLLTRIKKGSGSDNSIHD